MPFDPPVSGVSVANNLLTKTANSVLALRDGSAISGVQGGAGDDYTATFTPAFGAYSKAMRFVFTPNSNNVGGATHKVDALAVLPIQKWSRAALVALENDDLVNGVPAFILINEGLTAFILLNPSQITDAMLSTDVAIKSVVNTFSTYQEIDMITSGPILRALHASSLQWQLRVSNTEPKFIIADVDGVQRIRFNMLDGRMTDGVVPLARMAGIALLDSSTAVVGNTTTFATIQSASNSDRFYSTSIRGLGSSTVYSGAEVTHTEAVVASFHSVILRSSTTNADRLSLINGTTSSTTAIYKVYQLTEF